MRTIKFRGKRIDNGEWVYGNLYELPLGGNVCTILTTDNIHEDNSIEPQYHLAFTLWKDLFVVDSSTIGQFTGLLDKNGKEIYEGDIVKIKSQICGDLFYEVVYSINEAMFALKNDDNAVYRYFEEIAEGRRTEVIGNIHDNPELLKGGNNE